MIRRPPRSTLSSSSAASDVYKRQLLYCCNDVVDISVGQRRVHLEHQARLPQFSGNRQPTQWANSIERFLEVNLAATTHKTGNALGLDSRHDPVAVPIATQLLWTNKSIVLVIGVVDTVWRQRGAERWNCRKSVVQHSCKLPAPLDVLVKLAKQLAAEGGLHFGEPPVCAK